MSIAVQKNKNLFFFHTSCPLADQCSATTGNPRLDSRSSKRSAFLLELLIPINCKSNHHRNKNHSKNRQLWHTTSMSLVSKSLPFHYRNLEVEGSHPMWMSLLHSVPEVNVFTSRGGACEVPRRLEGKFCLEWRAESWVWKFEEVILGRCESLHWM